ncbi:MAG: sulfatase-like hydrolase/transferase [Rhodobacter sp.]|nr:sulfatase-like hydrolase/transferase [Paracoccaceae bacterium]MCC0076258.1 sulfatase-like hydrolase/transferase [Rhodobacter sp.]
MSARPNIVLIVTDQQRADHLSCAGNTVLQTPNIDRLAGEGTRFDNCYVANPICAPNRASILTGRMPSAHGVRSNGIPLSLDARTFVAELQNAGYATALVGKGHLQNITGLDREFIPEGAEDLMDDQKRIREAFDRDMYGDEYQSENILRWRADPDHRVRTPYYGFDHVDLAIWHGDMVGGDYEHWLDERCPDHRALRGQLNAEPDDRYSVPQAWRTRIPEEFHPSAFVAEKSIDYLRVRASEGGDSPFFLQVSFPDPHHPFTPPGKYWDMYDPDAMPLPASFGQGDTPILRHMRETRAAGTDFRLGQMPFAVSDREAREAIALTYGMISMIDDQVGRILACLEETGQIDNTVIIFTSDHGEMMGDHGILLKGPLHYRNSIRVPLLWREPGGGEPAVVEEMVSSIDISATILARAGVRPYYGIQGRVMPGLLDDGPGSRDAVLVEDDRERVYLNFDRPQRIRTIVTRKHRMTVFRPMAYGELFDLEADPDENVNLWDDPASQHVRQALTEQLLNLMIDTTDWTPAMTGRA